LIDKHLLSNSVSEISEHDDISLESGDRRQLPEKVGTEAKLGGWLAHRSNTSNFLQEGCIDPDTDFLAIVNQARKHRVKK